MEFTKAELPKVEFPKMDLFQNIEFRMPALSVIDMHCHTKEGSMDGHCSVFDSALKLKQMGFTGMVVADHNSCEGYDTWIAGKDDHPELNGFNVIRGLEYDTRDGGHVLCILPENVSYRLLLIRGMSVTRLLTVVHEKHGICGMCHPYGNGYFAAMHTNHVKNSEEIQKKFDFIETYNAHIKDEGNHDAELLAQHLKKPGTGGTDAHKIEYVGTASTGFDIKITNTDELIDGIMNDHIIAAGKVGSVIFPQQHGIIKWGGIAGYWVWNKAAALLYTMRRKKAFSIFEKNG